MVTPFKKPMEPRVRTTRPRGFQLGGGVGSLGNYNWDAPTPHSREQGIVRPRTGFSQTGYGNRGPGVFSQGEGAPIRTGVLRGNTSARERERQQRQYGQSTGWSIRSPHQTFNPDARTILNPDAQPSPLEGLTSRPATGIGLASQEWMAQGGRVYDRNQPGYAIGGLITPERPGFQKDEGVGTLIRPAPPTTDTVSAVLTPGEHVIDARNAEYIRSNPGDLANLQRVAGDIQRGSPSGSPLRVPSPLSGVVQAEPTGPTTDIGQIRQQPLAPLAQDDPLRTPVGGPKGWLEWWRKNIIPDGSGQAPEPLVRKTGIYTPPTERDDYRNAQNRSADSWQELASRYGMSGEDLAAWATEMGYTVLDDGTVVNPYAPEDQQRIGNFWETSSFISWKDKRTKEQADAQAEAKAKTEEEESKAAIEAGRQDRLRVAEKGIEAARTRGGDIIRRSAELSAKNKARAAGQATRSAFMAMATRPGEAGLAQAADVRQMGILAGASEQLVGELEAEKMLLHAELKAIDVEMANINERISFERDDYLRDQHSQEQQALLQQQADHNNNLALIQAQIDAASQPDWWDNWGPQILGVVGGIIGGMIGGPPGAAAGSAIGGLTGTSFNQNTGTLTAPGGQTYRGGQGTGYYDTNAIDRSRR